MLNLVGRLGMEEFEGGWIKREPGEQRLQLAAQLLGFRLLGQRMALDGLLIGDRELQVPAAPIGLDLQEQLATGEEPEPVGGLETARPTSADIKRLCEAQEYPTDGRGRTFWEVRLRAVLEGRR